MKIFVANTDPDWYRFLAAGEMTSEVNFWRPKGTYANFRAISPGELFFFRLRRPFNKIVGFGTFAHHSVLPLLMAWETFGPSSGCASLANLVSLIARHRGEKADLRTALAWNVGCTIVTDVHYYPESEWLDFIFPPGLVQGKSLEISSFEGQRIWRHMLTVLHREGIADEGATLGSQSDFSLVRENQAAYSVASTKMRPGQGTFRVMVLDAYHRRCAVTGERTLPVVQAAHIQPYISPDSNHVQNGLALREDFHTLFDRGYVAVGEDYRFLVSPRLREDYENGREYYRLHGKQILLPDKPEWLPSKDALRWHLENVYAD